MINATQMLFIDEFVLKGKTGKSNKTIAQEIGVSERTVMRWLNDDEIKREINRRASSVLDTMLPQLINNADNMVHSSNPNERVKGNELVLKLMEKARIQDELTVIERERVLIKDFIESCVTHSSFLKDIDTKLFLEVCLSCFIDEILSKGYEKPPMTAKEIEEFIADAEKTKKMIDNDKLHIDNKETHVEARE